VYRLEHELVGQIVRLGRNSEYSQAAAAKPGDHESTCAIADTQSHSLLRDRLLKKLCVQQLLAMIVALSIFSYATMPRPLSAAGPHVVSLPDLQKDMSASLETRAQNLADIERVLSLPEAQDAMSKSHLNASHVTAAIADLNDEEISRLAVKARAAEKDVQGGFIVGILALIGLVVVILIVLAVVNDDK
jgi:hypothetical protein